MIDCEEKHTAGDLPWYLNMVILWYLNILNKTLLFNMF